MSQQQAEAPIDYEKLVSRTRYTHRGRYVAVRFDPQHFSLVLTYDRKRVTIGVGNAVTIKGKTNVPRTFTATFEILGDSSATRIGDFCLLDFGIPPEQQAITAALEWIVVRDYQAVDFQVFDVPHLP